MATIIKGLTSKQDSLLRSAFGYESYPNGNSGHTAKAEDFLVSKGAQIELVSAGNAYSVRVIQVSDISALESEIEAIADNRKREKELRKERSKYIVGWADGGRKAIYSDDMPEELKL